MHVDDAKLLHACAVFRVSYETTEFNAVRSLCVDLLKSRVFREGRTRLAFGFVKHFVLATEQTEPGEEGEAQEAEKPRDLVEHD